MHKAAWHRDSECLPYIIEQYCEDSEFVSTAKGSHEASGVQRDAEDLLRESFGYI